MAKRHQLVPPSAPSGADGRPRGAVRTAEPPDHGPLAAPAVAAGVRVVPEPPHDVSGEGRRERHRRETLERLVRAARAIMFNRGFSDITVQDITDAADVGKGTFFNYFRSKEHIVTRVQEYNRRSITRAVEQVRSGERTPHEALSDSLGRLLCPTDGDWLTYQTNTMRALALHPDVRQYFSPELHSNLEQYSHLMRSAQQQRIFRGDVPAESLAMVTQTFFAGLTVLYWIHGVSPTIDQVSSVVGQLLALMEPRQAQEPAPRPPRKAKPAGRRAPRAAVRRKAAPGRNRPAGRR